MGSTKICGLCETSKNLTQYYKSPLDGTYLPICKNCAKKKYRYFVEATGKEAAGMWLICANLDMPFIFDIWHQVEVALVGAGPNTDYVMAYLKGLSESGGDYRGFIDSDRMLTDLVDNEVEVEPEEETHLDIKAEIRRWGKFVDEEGKIDEDAYLYLNQTFEDYTKDILDMDINLEKRYLDLAKAEFRKRKADESGDIQEISKAQDSLKKILDMLKLSDFKNNKQSEIDRHIERVIWTIENTKPAECEDLEKYKDFGGIGIKWDELLRPVRNLLAGTRDYPKIPKEEE